MEKLHCLKKTFDHIFYDKLSVYKDFWYTYYQEYRPSIGILFPNSPV